MAGDCFRACASLPDVSASPTADVANGSDCTLRRAVHRVVMRTSRQRYAPMQGAARLLSETLM